MRLFSFALLALSVALWASGPASAGGVIAFVVQLKAAPATLAADAAIAAHLRQNGYTVADVDQSAPASAAAGAAMILISSSVSAHKLEAKYVASPVPVVTWESYLLPHMGMSGLKEDRDYGTVAKNRYLWMVNAPHPLSAGLGHGLLNVYKRGGPMNFGHPGLGAIIISTIPGDPSKVTEFAYEKGATMDDENIAPARRVFLFLNNDSFPNLSPAGVKLFDAAINWAINGVHAQ